LNAIKQGGFPTWVAFICLIALSAALSSVSLLPFGFLSNLFWGKIPFSIFVPSLWVSVEFLRIEVLKEIIPFPWAPLGIQFLHTPLAQISEFTGVWGLSFISALIGSAILDSILKRKSIYIFVAFSVSISALVFGIMRGKQIEDLIKKQDEKNKLNVVALRTNFSREEKWKDVNLVLKKQIELTRSALEELRNEKEEEGKSEKEEEGKSDYYDDFVLVIWPELSFPIPFFNLWLSEIRKITSEKVFLIFGAPEFSGKGNFYFYNSAFFIGENIKGVQRKEKLVPFGEYIPGGIEMWDFLGDFLKKKLFGGFFEPWGGKREIFEIGFDEKLNFSVLICWEIAFSDLVREAVKGGADFLVNISNDVWFGGRWGEMQMWNLAVLRALENRIFIVRSTNKGVAGIIDPVGNFKFDDNTGYVLGKVGPKMIKSIYVGDVFAYASIVFCVFLLIAIMTGDKER